MENVNSINLYKLSEQVAENTANIKNLEGWQKQQNGSIQNINKAISEIKSDISDIKVALAAPHGPSWPVAIMITILCSVCTSLIIYIVTRGG